MERYETIVGGSDAAKRLCNELLEPAVDALYQESFRKHDATRAEFDRTEYYEDESSLSRHFSVIKSPRDDGGVYLCFNLEVSQQRAWEPGMFWPREREQVDEDDEDDDVLVFAGVDDDCQDEDDDFDDVFAIDHRLIVEIWHYFFDEEGYVPRKDIRFEYFSIDGELVDMICTSDADTKNKMLDEHMDTEVDLQIKDACLSQTFSEQDVRDIIGALACFGFKSDFSIKQ